MVREIIHIQVGQCGNQIGNAMWNVLVREHRIDTSNGNFTPGHKFDKEGSYDKKDQVLLDKVDVFFRPTGKTNAKYVPRAVLVDLEPGTLDVIKANPLGPLYKPDNMVFGSNGAGNNWAKGHYTEGAELIEQTIDVIRKETEGCDCPQGFQLCHSLGGGTGSGMGTLLLLKIRDAYPDRITTTYSVYPSPKVSDTVVEPYNAVLSTHQLLENADESFIIDNEALYNISHNVLHQNTPKYSELNHLIALAQCGITASLRFPGLLNSDLRKLGVNLVPFPRLHFFLIAFAPLFDKKQSERVLLNIKEVVNQCFSTRNFYSNVKPNDGKYLACSLTFRGADITSSEVDDVVDGKFKDMEAEFVTWIPNNLKTSIVDVPSTGKAAKSGTFVANTTALKGIFQRLATQFGAMYKRKAFLHWYKNEGMDEMEFQEADKNVRDLITEYQDKQDITNNEEEEEEEDDL